MAKNGLKRQAKYRLPPSPVPNVGKPWLPLAADTLVSCACVPKLPSLVLASASERFRGASGVLSTAAWRS